MMMIRKAIDLYKGNNAVATGLLQRAFWMRKIQCLKLDGKGFKKLYGMLRASNAPIEPFLNKSPPWHLWQRLAIFREDATKPDQCHPAFLFGYSTKTDQSTPMAQ